MNYLLDKRYIDGVNTIKCSSCGTVILIHQARLDDRAREVCEECYLEI